jgi:N4-(beta-N-acetylglucosaminyl)-L-asparaginase
VEGRRRPHLRRQGVSDDRGRGDVLDAVVAGVNIVELDPEESGVGYGGLPNAEGVVQLDASVMHGPKKRAGASPASKASARRRWWPGGDGADRPLLLVGQDAQRFARTSASRSRTT